MEEGNNIIENNNKKGNGSKAIIALLTIVIVLLIGLVILLIIKPSLFSSTTTNTNANSGATKDTAGTNATTTADEKVTFTDSELEEYINYISPISYGPSAKIYDTASINASNLSAREKIEYIGSRVLKKNTQTPTDDGLIINTISESDVKSLVEKTYGPNTYEKSAFNLGCGEYTLNESEKNYTNKTGGCGGTTATFVSNVVTGYKATKSKLEITTAYAFLNGETNKIYKDFALSNAVDDFSGNLDNVSPVLKEYVKNNKDKLNTIIYTFESSDGNNYYFTGFKNNK